MSANQFVLKHKQIEVEYTPFGITPGLTVLSYNDGGTIKKFTGNEVTVEETGVGRLISVALIKTIDAGGERFGFLLPQLNGPQGQIFHTVGVYWKFGGPDSVSVVPSWRCVEFQGKAPQSDIVPLAEAGAKT